MSDSPHPRPTALVTGGTSGIGAGVSHVLAAAGWRVFAGTVSRAEIEAFPPTSGIVPLLLDVTDAASVDAALAPRYMCLEAAPK